MKYIYCLYLYENINFQAKYTYENFQSDTILNQREREIKR